jgi:hypothetical protein
MIIHDFHTGRSSCCEMCSAPGVWCEGALKVLCETCEMMAEMEPEDQWFWNSTGASENA